MSTGLSFPIQISSRGGLKMSGSNVNNDKEYEIIKLRIGTKLGERVMHPYLGSSIDGTLYNTQDVSAQSLIKYEIMDCLKDDPRIQINPSDIDFIEKEDGKLDVLLSCKINGQNKQYNIPLDWRRFNE